MAITIDELQVETTPEPASAQANAAGSNAAAAGAGAKKDTTVGQLLELLQERTLRLRAD